MSCARSSGGAAVGDPSLGLGSSSSTCSLNGELGKGLRIFGGWIEKSTGESGGSGATTRGSGAITKGICVSSGKRSKTEEEVREVWK